MKMPIFAVTAVALLAVSSVSVSAQQRGGNAGGASEFSPGNQLRDQGEPNPGGRGASEFAPGDRKKDAPTTQGRGASEFSPGDQKNDRRKIPDRR
jgi:hypothetical protein